MREKFFDYDKFIESCFNNDTEVQSNDISGWLKCSVRLVQKWGMKNNVPFHRIKGIKHYIWDWETIENFGEWYNRKLNRPKKKYYKPKPKRENKSKVEKVKITIPFTTIMDIIDDVKIFQKNDKPMVNSTKIRYIQRWCKRHEIPYGNLKGHRHYIITPETKKRIIETLKRPDYIYHIFSKEDGVRNRNKKLRSYSR